MFALVFALTALAADPKPAAQAASDGAPAATPRALFDGKTLTGWTKTNFGGEGEVRIDDGAIVLEMGNNMTGITWADGERLPKVNYEIALQAKRIEGDDFFCGLTFPVGDRPCSFIVGGWGGATVGLSSLDDADASSNETTTYHSFDRDRWYALRVRVTEKTIEAWIDDRRVVHVDYAGRKLSVRSEVELSRPLGIATWVTTAAVRKIELRTLSAAK